MMNYRISLCLIVCFLGVGSAWGEFSTWTGKNGAQIEAQLIEVTSDRIVILEGAEGQKYSISLDDLVEADQARASSVQDEDDAAEEEDSDYGFERSGPVWLPVFEQGPHAGYFAVVEHPFYRFAITGSGDYLLLLKEESGQVVGQPVRIRGLNTYYIAPDLRSRREGQSRAYHRPVAQLDGAPLRPMLNPSALRIAGRLESDVTFSQSFTFTKDSVHIEFDYADPKIIEYPTKRGALRVRLEPSHAIAPEMEQEERKVLLADCVLTLQAPGGKRKGTAVEYPYWKSITRLPNNIERATFKGPWGPRVWSLSFRGALARAGGVYRGNCLWQGYGLGVEWTPDEVKKSRVTINIQ